MSRPIKRFDWKTLEEYFDKTELRESSKTSIETRIRKILNDVFGRKDYSINELKKSPQKVCDYISKGWDIRRHSTKKTYLFAMTHLYKALNVKYDCITKQLKETMELAEAERAGEMNEKTKEKFNKVNFKELKEKAKKEENPDLRLVYWLYSAMPPLRGNEWRGTRVVANEKKGKDSENFVALKEKKLIVNKSKTSETHGKKVIDLPTEVVNELKKYVASKEHDILFDDYSASTFTKMLNKNLGFSIHALRKRYVSEHFDKMTPKERVELARTMGHTIQTAMLDYKKPIEVVSDEED